MKYGLLTLIVMFLSVGLLTVAQTTPATATPAPTKTPIPTTPIIAPTTEATAVAVTFGTLAEPYTQEDLQVLVGNVQRPNGIVWFNGFLYTACNGDYTLYQINAETGITETLIFGVQNAHSLYAEATDDGYNLWIPDFDTNQVVLVDQRRTAPNSIVDENLNGPWGIAYLNENEFLVTNIRGNTIHLINRSGDNVEVASGFRAPAGIVVDADTVYVVNNGSARRAIEWFETGSIDANQTVSDIGKPLVSGLQNASGLVLGNDGYLYFTYSLGTRGIVGRVNPTECKEKGGCTNEDVEIVVYSDLQAPLAGLTISPDMRLFFHTIFRPELYWVDIYR